MNSRTIVCLLVLVALGACVDAAQYDSPCTGSFNDLLRCGRETGGADPSASNRVDEATAFDCRDACEVFAECGFLWMEEIDECISECQSEGIPQTFLDCVGANGCNFEVCFQVPL